MKKQILALVAAAAALAVLAPLTVTLSAAQVTCRVPFSFIVNGKTMAPGRYLVETRDAALIVSGTHSSAVVLANPALSRTESDKHAKLVFLKSGDRYDLIEVWTGTGNGRQIAMPRNYRKSLEDRARAANMPLDRIVITADVENR